MIITKVEEGKGKRHRVFGEEQFLFSLYDKEIKQFHIMEGGNLPDHIITDILDSVIYKRAKERSLYLLERRPFSVHMMRNKLRDHEYPEDIIDKVILFLQSYHYLDDAEYTRMYIHAYSEKKSRKQIVCDLYRKGISKDMIEEYFDENEYSEQSCFVRQFQKYSKNKDLQDYATRQKIFRYFYGKGFSATMIETYLNQVSQ